MAGSTKLLAVALFLSAMLSSCVTSPTGRKQFMIISPESAIVESRKAYAATVTQLNDEEKLLRDPALAKRVRLITGHLITEAVKEFPRSTDWEWSVALIDEPEVINAWCMAGGRMAVYSGLFVKLELTDDEFAHIMGHEIAHALANHTAEQMSVALATGAATVAVGVATASNNSGGLALAGAALAASLAVQMPNSRAAEREADEMGARLTALAGYEPSAAVTLWEKMGAAGGGRVPEFLSTHPAPHNRSETLKAMIPELDAIKPDKHPEPSTVNVIY